MTNRTFPAFADATVPFVAPVVDSLGDDELLALQRTVAELRRRVDTTAATVAAELARRSRRDLGSEGLAQRLGARTPETLVARVAGTSAREAAALVRIGTLLAESARLADGPSPAGSAPVDGPVPDPSLASPVVGTAAWLRPVAIAVAEARLSLEAAEAIRLGLGAPGEAVAAESLTEAAAVLVAEAPALTLERLAARARELRADLDDGAVRTRERESRERRFLSLTRQADGMTRLHGLLDPESAAVVVAAVDAATSPRRGGPRFVDPSELARAERLARDPRTIPQLALDSLVELVRLGSAADDGAVLGARTPAVRVLVTDADLARRASDAAGRRRAGRGFLEGQSEPVSIETVERHVCASGTVPIHFDANGRVVNVGREQRLFTVRQRVALAARDGGCRFPGCERPPSWCEAHHIVPWQQGGRTDVDVGVLLCRHHHLLVHDNGWRIERSPVAGGDGYAAVPPRALDPERRPIPMPAKSPAARRLAG